MIEQIEDLDFECVRLRSRLAYETRRADDAWADLELARAEVSRLRAIVFPDRKIQAPDEVPF